MNSPKWEIFSDKAGEWRWRLVAGNGETVATSESYTRRADADRAIDTIEEMIRSTVGGGTFSVIKRDFLKN